MTLEPGNRGKDMINQEQELNKLYPGVDWSLLPKNLVEVLPRDKTDTQRALLAVKLGYPKVGPILPILITWLQDINWPVAEILATFFSTIGLPLEDIIRPILRSKDEIWKYWVLSLVVDVKDLALAKALRRDIETLLTGDDSEGVPEVARKILMRLEIK